MPPLSWTTLEYEKKARHPDWIWTAGLIALLTAVVSFFYGNIFFGIFIVIAGIVTIIYAKREPKQLSITITESALVINEETIPFKNVTAFWLDDTGKQGKLLLLVRGTFVPTLSIPIEGVTSEQVRNALSSNIKEEELRESRSVALFDRLGF